MNKTLSATFWGMVLAIIWMVAGHPWAGTLLGVLAAVWVVLTIVAAIDFLDEFL